MQKDDQKGYGSNAHWWLRLKTPDMLRPYLRIADSLGIAMPVKQKENWEYDPKAKPPLRMATQPIVFYKPYNAKFNIFRARDAIAEHLSRNNLSLGAHIKECDLNQIQTNEGKTSNATGSWVNPEYAWDEWNKVWRKPTETRVDPWKSHTVDALRARSKAALDRQELIRDALIYGSGDARGLSSSHPAEQMSAIIKHLSDDQNNGMSIVNKSNKRVHWNKDPDYEDTDADDANEASASPPGTSDEENDAFSNIKSLDSDDNVDSGDESAYQRRHRYAEWRKKRDEPS